MEKIKQTLSAREFCKILFEGAMTTKEVLQRINQKYPVLDLPLTDVNTRIGTLKRSTLVDIEYRNNGRKWHLIKVDERYYKRSENARKITAGARKSPSDRVPPPLEPKEREMCEMVRLFDKCVTSARGAIAVVSFHSMESQKVGVSKIRDKSISPVNSGDRMSPLFSKELYS